jgi:ketosteroid isomerase-like protein
VHLLLLRSMASAVLCIFLGAPVAAQVRHPLDPPTRHEHRTLLEVLREAGHHNEGTAVPLAALLASDRAPGWSRTAGEPLHPLGAACAADLLNEETVVRVNAGYESTLRASDVDALHRILAPDFMFITSSGEVRDRQELLRSYGAKEVSLRVFTSENVRVRFRGNVSILTADITKEGDYLSGPRAGAVFTGRYRFTRVYACSSEGWQLVSTHESQLSM